MVQISFYELEAIEKIENKRLISYVWVGRDERIQLNDNLVELEQIRTIMYDKRVAMPNVIVSFRVDKNSNMGVVTDIQQELRMADARRINYSKHLKQ